MGKTGSTEWTKIKGRKGQIRLVARSESSHKNPGPMQKYTSSGTRRRKIARSAKAIAR
ncbi:MAG TPA: DUF5350 family protein [Methanotrichaceae archaeon]|nr:DUF5350 family protein [Methanotrichaceae archaeon]